MPIMDDIENGKWMCDGRDGGARVNCNTSITRVPPVISFFRSCNLTDCTTVNPGDSHRTSWILTNTTNASYTCTSGPSDDVTNLNVKRNMGMLDSETRTYEELIANYGWKVGHYTCAVRAIGPGGVSTKDISFDIAPL